MSIQFTVYNAIHSTDSDVTIILINSALIPYLEVCHEVSQTYQGRTCIQH